MLETPLFGRFQGENKRLLFAPAPAYLGLVNGTMVAGGVFVLAGLLGGGTVSILHMDPSWCFFTGSMVLGASAWANFSLARITFDLRERFYKRRQGPGILPRTTHGSMNNLDAVVLISEMKNVPLGGVTYHLVLYWKQMQEPLMVLQSDTRAIGPGQPLNAGAGQLLQAGMAFARAMNLTFYDNSAVPSASPIPLF